MRNIRTIDASEAKARLTCADFRRPTEAP
jgi:hypothetical protein